MQDAGYPHGKGGRLGYEDFKKMIRGDRRTRREAFRALLKASFEFDDKHDGKGSFVVHMLGSFLGGCSYFSK